SSVAIFGAGTIGLLAAYSSLLKGAAEVYVIDFVRDRLDKAAEIGATPVDLSAGDPVEHVRELRRRRQIGRSLPAGEQLMDGVMCGIDAVGFQARDRSNVFRELPIQVIDDLARLVNPTGHIGIAGVYTEKDEHPAPEGHCDGSLRVPWATLFTKG